jgi:hypothetical protein
MTFGYLAGLHLGQQAARVVEQPLAEAVAQA